MGPRLLSPLLAVLLMAVPAFSRWCQVENVKSDPNGDYTFSGPWRIDGCTTLSLDHGKCDEEDCPHRVKFVDDEIIELADALHGNTVLTALSMVSNNITDESVKAIAEALRDNEALMDLNLYDSMVSDDGAIALAEAFAENEVFNSLNLEHNNIGDEGAQVLLDLLKSNESAFETLHLKHNRVSPALLEEIEAEMDRQMRPPPDLVQQYYDEQRDEL